MSVKSALRLVLTLALMFLFGVTSVGTADAAVHFGGMWPAGLATGALLISPRHLAPFVGGAIAVLGAAAFALGGYPLGVSIGFGVGIAVEAAVAHQLLTMRWTRQVSLRDNGDFARMMAGCFAGALAGAVVFAVVAGLASHGTAWKVGVATFVTHAAGQLVLVGLFKEPTHQVRDYGRVEQVCAWVNTVVVSVLAFLPSEIPSLAFLVVPGLGWVALRAPMREATVQLVFVAVIASTLTSAGYGPFSDSDLLRHLDPELRLLPLQAFLVTCAMVTIPFSMAVGRERRSAAAARFEKGRTDNLVRSALGIAIIGTDEHGRITLFNPGAERILGYTADEVLGRTTAIFHPPESIARMARAIGTEATYAALVRHMQDHAPRPALDIEFRRKDGEKRILSTIISPVFDERGQFVGYVATGDDATERLETQAALEAALSTEREAVRRLTEVDQVKDRFVSSVSHELRTPITNIVGYLELLMDGVYGQPNDAQSRAMSRIETNSRRLLSLIDDLLTLSSIESLDQNRELADVDLVSVVRRAEEIVQPSLLRRDLRFEVVLPEHPVIVPGDAGQLERLVINLATNAIKFTPDGGAVTVRVLPALNGTGPVVEVEDTGVGIPESDQPMLFSRFFRAAQAREEAVPGSGLGLSIAKTIAELHGGRISATSVYGAGSTFRLELPVPAAAQDVAPPTGPPAEAGAEA